MMHFRKEKPLVCASFACYRYLAHRHTILTEEILYLGKVFEIFTISLLILLCQHVRYVCLNNQTPIVSLLGSILCDTCVCCVRVFAATSGRRSATRPRLSHPIPPAGRRPLDPGYPCRRRTLDPWTRGFLCRCPLDPQDHLDPGTPL